MNFIKTATKTGSNLLAIFETKVSTGPLNLNSFLDGGGEGAVEIRLKLRDTVNLGYFVVGSQLLEALENGVSKWPQLEGRFPQVK